MYTYQSNYCVVILFLVVFYENLEVGSVVITYWTFQRRFLALENMPAVTTFPFHYCGSLEDLVRIHIVK